MLEFDSQVERNKGFRSPSKTPNMNRPCMLPVVHHMLPESSFGGLEGSLGNSPCFIMKMIHNELALWSFDYVSFGATTCTLDPGFTIISKLVTPSWNVVRTIIEGFGQGKVLSIGQYSLGSTSKFSCQFLAFFFESHRINARQKTIPAMRVITIENVIGNPKMKTSGIWANSKGSKNAAVPKTPANDIINFIASTHRLNPT